MSEFIERYSSRQTKLHESALLPHLRQARRYYRIAGYFTSSLFEIAGEAITEIEDVRIVCNSDVQYEDLEVANLRRAAVRRRESALLGRLEPQTEVDALRNRERYQLLESFLQTHPGAIRVAPDEHCGFLHGKAGLIERVDGQRIAFIGSMNETRSGWTKHYEILWADYSPEGVQWVEDEFEYLWRNAVSLPQVVLKEIQRRTHRVEVDLQQIEDEEEIPPAALIESPMYREGLSLSPWQRAFVSESLKHLRWFGCVRLLVADEVGLGKTLSLATAALALTLQEDQARNERQRPRPVAIFAPKALIEQWQTELYDKLGVPTARWGSQLKAWLDPDNRVISPSGAEQVSRCPFRIGILSTGIITQPTKEREILESMSFDTLVLDESHKARKRKIPGRGETWNELLKFMYNAANRSRHVLLGTATPMQTEVSDLWDQLQILDRGARFVLGHEFSPWRYPDHAIPLLTGEDPCEDPEQAWRYLKSPLPPVDSSQENDFRRVIFRIREELGLENHDFETKCSVMDLDTDIREDLEDLLRDRLQGTTFFQRHNPAVRHVVLRKRQVLENAGLLDRVGVILHPDPNQVSDINNYQALFEDKALFTTDTFQQAYEAAKAFGNAYGKRVGGSGFMTNMMRQRLCSSIYAGKKTAQKLLEGQHIEEEVAEQEEEIPSEDMETDKQKLSAEERDALEEILEAIEAMQGEDPKLQAVRHYLDRENWIYFGCIIFSQYYDTAYWIATHLAGMFPDKLIGIYAGGGKSLLLRGPESNFANRESLKSMVEEREIRIMVATDAACEGLNLQRLGTLINVDLPWNPVRLEQRIGRIKRFGQTRPNVDMLNLVYQGTVDETIYNRLSERMKDRYDLFGSLPDTIDDEWIEDEERLAEELDKYIEAQERVNGFDLRYNEAIDTDEDAWRECVKVLSRRNLEDMMRRGW